MRKDNLILKTIPVICISFFISCKKDVKSVNQNPVSDSSHISITNVSPSISNLQFYLNDSLVSLPDSPLSYGKTVIATYINNANINHPDTTLSPYIHIPSGY